MPSSETDPTSPEAVRDRRAQTGAWLLLLVMLMVAAAALLRGLG